MYEYISMYSVCLYFYSVCGVYRIWYVCMNLLYMCNYGFCEWWLCLSVAYVICSAYNLLCSLCMGTCFHVCVCVRCMLFVCVQLLTIFFYVLGDFCVYVYICVHACILCEDVCLCTCLCVCVCAFSFDTQHGAEQPGKNVPVIHSKSHFFQFFSYYNDEFASQNSVHASLGMNKNTKMYRNTIFIRRNYFRKHLPSIFWQFNHQYSHFYTGERTTKT